MSGDKKQIEKAREMIKEVMNQIWLLPSSWGQHFLLGVAISNHYSISSTEEVSGINSRDCRMLIVGKIALRLETKTSNITTSVLF